MAFILDPSAIFGSKPDVVGFPQMPYFTEALDAVLNDINLMPNFERLANWYQSYMQGQFAGAGLGNLKGLIGGGAQNVATAQAQAQQELMGQVPADVIGQEQRLTAFQNQRSGLAGTPAGAANYSRNFMDTSFQMIQQGQQLAGQAANAAQLWQNIAEGTILSPAGFMITPAQQAQWDLSQAEIQHSIAQERANVAAAPDPIAHGISDIVMYLTGQYLGSLGGGKFGGGGGGGLPGAGNAAAEQAAGGGLGAIGGPAGIGVGATTGGLMATPGTPAPATGGAGGAVPIPAINNAVPLPSSDTGVAGGSTLASLSLNPNAYSQFLNYPSSSMPYNPYSGLDIYGTTAFSQFG